MKNERGQLNISFGWLFAIIVGAVIIFLAILGATKVIKIGQQEGQAVGAKELGILLNPLEIGFGSAISTPLLLRVETRIFNKCSVSGNFGKQGIQTSEFSFNKWTIPGVESSFENKYIFSKSSTQGKKFYIFSKPFEFPFKVSDLIYLTSENEKYCFDNAPENIAEEILQLNQGNLAANCSKVDDKTIKVCFNKNCGINVNYNSKYVQKGEDKSYFEEDALMYAAIFSDKEIYECQVKRLMKRTKQLAELYKEKELLVSQKNCAGELAVDLDLLIGNLENAKDYKIINDVSDLVEDIKNKNEYSKCALW
ncbi:MAG TPA: hypothetical protein VJA20_01145 [Candidatus Nanoarchaeia archaeon]|nr:hypothetical protein [Candidatus Nanoarchaeia archaeon]